MSPWSERSQSAVLCEGFHDRYFWKGLLEHVGLLDPGKPAGRGDRIPYKDPFDEEVTRGHFGFRTSSDRFVRVQPCGGIRNVLPQAKRLLRGLETKPIERIVLVEDPDTVAGSADDGGPSAEGILASIRGICPDAVITRLRDIDTNARAIISLVRWECEDITASGLPPKQTLERLVSAAIIEAYPDRGSCVHNWLGSRCNFPEPCGKEYSWSYMAGWYANRGCDEFLRSLWEDPPVAVALEKRLRASGAWRIIEELAK